MYTQKPSSMPAAKLKAIIGLTVLCLLTAVCSSYAQAPVRTNDTYWIAPFGVTYKNSATNITLDEMLKNPAMLCVAPQCEIVSFTISFLPAGKDFIGPFTIVGTPRINGMALETIQKLKENGEKNVRVFIENIKAKSVDGVVRSLSPMIFTSTNP